MQFMKSSFPIGIFIQIQQGETGLQLAAYLFFQKMRKLHAGIAVFKLFSLFFIA